MAICKKCRNFKGVKMAICKKCRNFKGKKGVLYNEKCDLCGYIGGSEMDSAYEDFQKYYKEEIK